MNFTNANFTINGLRVHNIGDGIRVRAGADNFRITGVHLSFIHDDCIENDQLYTGVVEDSLLDYIAEIVGKTRGHRALYFGASPRASIALLAGAQARAAAAGRDFVIPDDIKALAAAALRHRVGLQPDAEIEGVSTDECVGEILREARVPMSAA